MIIQSLLGRHSGTLGGKRIRYIGRPEFLSGRHGKELDSRAKGVFIHYTNSLLYKTSGIRRMLWPVRDPDSKNQKHLVIRF